MNWYLIDIIKLSIWNIPFDEEPLYHLTENEWYELFLLACRQGIAAIFFDGVDKLKEKPSGCKKLMVEEGLQTIVGSETMWLGQLQLAVKLSELYREHNVRMMLLKGLGLSLLYPNPKHRESGDIDIYLFGDYEKGNQLAQSYLKAKVDKFSKKEDHIIIGDCSIDNHICFLWTSNKRKKEFDAYLKGVLRNAELQHFPDTNILLPPAEFNLLFLLSHSYSHFMREGMPLRQVTDSACFLKRCEQEIDWMRCVEILHRFKLKKFADAVIAFIAAYFGIVIAYKPKPDVCLIERMKNDILDNNHAVIYHQSRIGSKIYVAKTAWKNRWRYNAFYEGGFRRFALEAFLQSLMLKR